MLTGCWEHTGIQEKNQISVVGAPCLRLEFNVATQPDKI
jgi:hypothetical protein